MLHESEKGKNNMMTEDILKRIDELIVLGDAVLATKTYSQYSGESVDHGKFRGFRAASLSFIESFFGVNQTYYKEFMEQVDVKGSFSIEAGINILQAAKAEIEGGWFITVKGIVSAEIFADFLEMAEHLLEENYKDAAAVMTGSILEEHLRKLCGKNNIPVTVEKDGKTKPKKADTINQELSKAEVYNKLEMKQITTWLDLRNNAAHGHYDEYSKEQVTLMLQGVQDFMNRVSV
jgi:hypothetical protein